ncbi:hypothetical protein ACFOMD_10655 [Sphingoaurantiacus capsulatus]|uniref:Uncharacterized protein n=1 Tax=Sphingoaurantiacus capsulatus TaxID=1771310 RepID=A0ABV7XA71_9SPHN
MGMRLGSVSMMAATAVAILAFNTLSLHVSAERAKVDRLQTRIAADLRDIRALEAELRTRARLPVLQTWNDNVLAMSAPTARQFADSPVQLASFASPMPAAKPAAPTMQLALATPETEVAPKPGIVKAAYEAPAPVATVAATGPREMVITYGAADLGASRAAPARPVATPVKAASVTPKAEPKKAAPEVKKTEKPAEPVKLAEAKPKPKPPAAKAPAKPSDLDALMGAIDNAAATSGGFQKVSMQ